MTVLGCGDFKPKRITGEINVHGTTGYTTTWNNSSSTSAFYVWDVAGSVPKLVDSVMVTGASTLGDVVVTADGRYLVVATEYAGGSIVIYSLTDPRKPQLVSRFTNTETAPGVHTAEVGRGERQTVRLPLRRSGRGAGPARHRGHHRPGGAAAGVLPLHRHAVRARHLPARRAPLSRAVECGRRDLGHGWWAARAARPRTRWTSAGADGERPRAQHLVAEGPRHGQQRVTHSSARSRPDRWALRPQATFTSWTYPT